MKYNSGKVTLAAVLTVSAIFFGILSSNTQFAFAHNNNPTPTPTPSCGTFVYEFTNDGNNGRVDVNFESNDNQIDVSGLNGWSVTKVELDVDNDNHSGYFQYSSGSLNNFNPNPGNTIYSARVTVTKSCATPTATPTTTPTWTPTATPFSTWTPTASPTSQSTYSPTPTATPTDDPCEGDDCNESTPTPEATATPTPNGDICANLDGIQLTMPDEYHQAGENCLKFELGGAPTPPPASNTQVLGASTTGKVLGASTMAGTGAVEDAIFNSMFTLGSLLTSFGIMKNGKKKS